MWIFAALKTDAGWSSMFSAASGESLKEIKDRMNIRKRGTNARTAAKEKHRLAATAAATAPKPQVDAAAANVPVRKCVLVLC